MEERLKIMHITFGVFPTAGKRGKQKTPPAAAKGDAQHRDTTLLRRFLAKSGLMERPHARCCNGHTRSGLTRRAQPDGSGAMFAGAAVSAFTLPDSLVTEAAPGTLPIYAIDT